MEIPCFIYITSMRKVGTSLTAVTEIDQTTLQESEIKTFLFMYALAVCWPFFM